MFMKIRGISASLVLVTATMLLSPGSHAVAQPGTKVFQALLEGFQETPAISTNGTGAFRATLNTAGTELSYELTYSGLEGGNTLFAHVHIGQPGVAGGVMFFLCGGGGKPACPNTEATVTGPVNASNVIGPAGQGITAGQFEEAIRAMRSGVAYANVHTVTYPTGEIRGQINDGRR
jgi:hypothetical protein